MPPPGFCNTCGMPCYEYWNVWKTCYFCNDGEFVFRTFWDTWWTGIEPHALPREDLTAAELAELAGHLEK
jgi:hypothetical protein